MGRAQGCWWFFFLCPCASPGAASGGWGAAGPCPPALLLSPSRVTAVALDVPGVSEGHSPVSCSMQREGDGAGDSCLKKGNASFPAPSPPDFAPLSRSWCARPLCPRPGVILHPAGCGQDPSPQGGLCGQEFVPASGRWRVPSLSSGWPWRKVTLPLGDVCIPFLNCPNKAFPLGGSCYSPDSASSLFRMGARGGTLNPGPRSPLAPPGFAAGSLVWGSPVS